MLKFILVSILVSLIIYRLIGWLFRFLMLRTARRMGQQAYEFRSRQAGQRANRSRRPRREGEIEVMYVPEPNKGRRLRKNLSNVEDVDYEEIK